VTKIVTLLLVLVFLAASCTVVAKPVKAQYQGDITIKADGTVEPANAPIQQVRDTYTLTGDVGGIGVQRSNIILVGNGHTLPGEVTSFDETLGINVTVLNSGGVFLKNVENVIVKNLTIKNSQIGIYLEQCSNVTVSGNTITGTHVPVPGMQATAAIFVWAGSSNTITENELTNNYYGICMGYNSQQNTITRNNITNSVSSGVILWDASNNVFYNNSFIDNAMQVSVKADGVNVWDYDTKGNFWSDYNGTAANSDGVGDTPYVINENNQDNYPLMLPYKEPEPTPAEPFPTTLAAVATGTTAAVAVSAGLIVYFKKRSH
jgi:parallel beta-helix repeat protein